MAVEIQYTSLQFEFPRKPFDKLTSEEFYQLRSTGDDYIKYYIASAKRKFDEGSQPDKNAQKKFLISIAGTVLSLVLCVVFLAFHFKGVGSFFGIATAVGVITCFLVFGQWNYARMHSSQFGTFRRAALAYFRFHHKYATMSSSYAVYVENISKATAKEYQEFMFAERNS